MPKTTPECQPRRDHFEASERLSNPRPRLVAEDRAQQETSSGRLPTRDLRGSREHSGDDQAVAVQRGERMVVVEFEPLDETGVEHRGRRGAGRSAAPSDESRAFPASSRLVTPSTPMRETGSWAPTRAQATPSSSRCFARSRTEVGMSSSVVLASQVASRPVGPFGSVAARARLPATSESMGFAGDSHEQLLINLNLLSEG